MGNCDFLKRGNNGWEGTPGFGSATLTTSLLSVGPHAITASYGGDAAYTGSSSATAHLDVTFTSAVTVTASDVAGDSNSSSVVVTIQ